MASSDGEAEVAGEGEAELVSQIQKMREEVQSLIATMREEVQRQIATMHTQMDMQFGALSAAREMQESTNVQMQMQQQDLQQTMENLEKTVSAVKG